MTIDFTSFLTKDESVFSEKWLQVKRAINEMDTNHFDAHWDSIVSQTHGVMVEMETAWRVMASARRVIVEEVERTRMMSLDKADRFNHAGHFMNNAGRYSMALTTFDQLRDRFLHLYDIGILLGAWSPARPRMENDSHVGETGIECPFCDRELDWNGHLHVFCCDCCDYKWKDAAEIKRDRKLVAMAYSQMTGGLDG